MGPSAPAHGRGQWGVGEVGVGECVSAHLPADGFPQHFRGHQAVVLRSLGTLKWLVGRACQLGEEG